MSVRNIVTDFAGEVGVNPRLVRMVCDDDFATITTAGYLNKAQATLGSSLLPSDVVFAVYSGGVGMFTLSFSTAGVITMQLESADVVTPVTANHMAVFVDSEGTLGDDAATAINGGNLQAGLSGTAGYLASFPSTAAKGSLRLTAVANAGDTLVTLSNASHAQASVYSIPDCGAATANFIMSKLTGTQHITVGSLQVDAGALISGISTGGFVGSVIAYPTTATSGFIALGAAINASGNFGTTISNSTAQAQAQTITIPSAGAATANFVLTACATAQSIGTGINITGANNLQVLAGNVLAGSDGNAGTVVSYPATATNGTLILAAVNAGGAFNTTISNGTMAQSCVYTIPDVTAATGQFLVKTAALVDGNLIQASGAAGVCVDSGVATTNVQLKTQVKAATTANIGGAGAGPLTITVDGVTASSVVIASIATSSNIVSVSKVTPGSGGFDILLSGDPGATLTVSYIAYLVAQ